MRSIPKVRLIPCACGCNDLLLNFDVYTNEPRLYIRGHNSKGENNGRWNNGRSKSGNGYITILKPTHLKASKRGYVYEHVLVFEEFYNCCVLKWGIVHHKNGIKTDNRPENLEGMLHSKHSSIHNIGKIITLETRKKLIRPKSEEHKNNMKLNWHKKRGKKLL